MAHGTKGSTAAAPATNGVSGTHPPAPVAVNRKKQKRREKQAAKQAAELAQNQSVSARNGHSPQGQSATNHKPPRTGQQAPEYVDPDIDDLEQFEPLEGDYYSEEEGLDYEQAYGTNGHHPPSGYSVAGETSGMGKKSKKKKKPGPGAHPQPQYGSVHSHAYPTSLAPPPPPPPPPHTTANAPVRGKGKDRIWNTSTSEERERIKEFWLSLGEDERKSLVKIEKEAVLRKMKEQQKHSCSCTVCGRKRTAIEEELEVLYDAYYEELEHRLPPDRMPHMMSAHHPARLRELPDDESEEEEDELDEEEYSDEEEYDDEDDISEEDEPLELPRGPANDFFNFGNSLTVKGGILTVADDLLKNDGKKFIEMMEQLAERRMQREEEAQYAAAGLSHPMYSKSHSAHSHGPPPDEEEYDDEDDEQYSDDEEYEDDEDDDGDTMTEEQRMEEGRRMFQIFAARMFEQRVLTAYREKVAAERQARLLEELEEESRLDVQREAKKAKEAQKRKEKKEKQKQAKAEEKAKKDAEKAAEEAAAKAAEEKKLEEQRRKKEEQRKKKEAERKAQDEEKQKKEAERTKRQQEERERQQEVERKAREQKALEKKTREEAKKKEREEREAKEKEAREKKAQEDKERREREVKARAEKERSRKDDSASASSQTPISTTKKSSQPVAVALPPGLLKQPSSTGFPSPHVQVATPAIPKAPTPNRPRQSSQQGSHGSSPKTPQVAPGTSKSMSPSNANPQQPNPIAPKSILTKPQNNHQPALLHHPQPTSPLPPMQPPPGMQPPGFNMPPPGLNGFPHHGPPPSMGGPRHSMSAMGHNMPMYPPQPNPQFRPFPPPGMPGPPPGMPMGRGGFMDGPPGFMPTLSGLGAMNSAPGFPGMGMPNHSRQHSASFDKPNVEQPVSAPQAQPIARPAPIQRPSSTKPTEENKGPAGSEVDELADHLGSKALLDDADDVPEFQQGAEPRRTSLQAGNVPRNGPMGFGFPEPLGQPRADSYVPFGAANNGSAWTTPPMPFPMSGAPGWGNSPTSGMFNNPFARMGNRQHSDNRLVAIRILVCHACKYLQGRGSPDGHYDMNDVLNQIDAIRTPADPIDIKMEDVIEACDVIGDSRNGGGALTYKENGGRLSVMLEEGRAPSGPPAHSLGEIGSPLPGHSVPATSAIGPRPFPPLGPMPTF